MQRDVFWIPCSESGLEHLRLTQDTERILADGIVVGLGEGEPFRAHYEVRCDSTWSVREVGVELLSPSEQRVEFRADGKGHWTTASGESVPALDSCIDVDILITPFTNTLPVRRLALEAGAAAEILVAYITVPEMQVRPVRQRYTCLSVGSEGGLYRYESLSAGFSAEIPVDGDGLVKDYPAVFKRVWSR